jgi:hypothetical protein
LISRTPSIRLLLVKLHYHDSRRLIEEQRA